MRYYLVALLDEDSCKYVEKIQKNLCQKYKLYNDLPILHISIEVIGDPDIEKLSDLVVDVIKPYKRFKVGMNGDIYIDTAHKSVNLKIENKGYIVRLVRKINSTLNANGFNVRDNIENLDLHISLASINYAMRELSIDKYSAASTTDKDPDSIKLLKIDRLELWKSINNKKKMVVKKFPLRTF